MTVAPPVFAARYFDGRSSRPTPVQVEVEGGHLRLVADGLAREAALRELRVSERLAAAPRLITFADGAYLEADDHAAVDAALAVTGHRESWVVLAQNRWPYAVAALLLSIAVLALGYVKGLPMLAEALAYQVSPQVEAAIGQRAVAVIDRRLFGPSELPVAQRERLAARFAAMVPADARAYRIEFRTSRIGPNAIALPGGIIVMTDELVRLMPDDDAVLGVLAHELGHIERRHFLRRLISSTVTGAVATLIAGDASGVLSALPATLAELSYAREQELEADAYAADLLRANGISPMALAQALEALEAAHRERAGQRETNAASDERWRGYLSTHPDTDERIARLRAAR